jgi:hypothetical protein
MNVPEERATAIFLKTEAGGFAETLIYVYNLYRVTSRKTVILTKCSCSTELRTRLERISKFLAWFDVTFSMNPSEIVNLDAKYQN